MFFSCLKVILVAFSIYVLVLLFGDYLMSFILGDVFVNSVPCSVGSVDACNYFKPTPSRNYFGI
jgi:hypothetical protein